MADNGPVAKLKRYLEHLLQEPGMFSKKINSNKNWKSQACKCRWQLSPHEYGFDLTKMHQQQAKSNNCFVCSLLFISVDSFLSVMWPMQYRIGDIVSTKKAITMVVLLWIGTILLSFLPVLAKDVVVYGLSYYTFQYIPVVIPIAVRRCEIAKRNKCFSTVLPLFIV